MNAVYTGHLRIDIVSRGPPLFGSASFRGLSPSPWKPKWKRPGSHRCIDSSIRHRRTACRRVAAARRTATSSIKQHQSCSRSIAHAVDAMAFLFADRPALLKDLDNDEARVIEYERVRDRWFAFTVPFSIAHGCVVTLITYASTVQGTELANCGLAAFYACYTLSALTLATVFVDREGPRRAMLIGFGAYCILAFSYALFFLQIMPSRSPL